MKLRHIIIAAAAVLASAACSKMNDNIDQYLSQGEIIYIARPDSVHLFAGKERFKVDFWISDPRATEMRIYWAQKSDSLVVPIPEGWDFNEVISVIADRDITEGQYSLDLVTRDKFGNISVGDEENVTVYGDIYQNSLNSRLVESQTAASGKLTINWGNCYSDDEIGIRVSYTDLNGAAKAVTYETETLGTSSVINNVDTAQEVSYTTMYLPEPTAIDTFFTPKKIIAF